MKVKRCGEKGREYFLYIKVLGKVSKKKEAEGEENERCAGKEKIIFSKI